MNIPKWWIVLASLALAVPSLVSCIHEEAANSSSSDAGETREAKKEFNLASVDLPIQDFMPTANENLLIDRARNALAVKCMEGKGYAGFSLPAPVADGRDLTDRRYGLSDIVAARAHGYELPKIRESGTGEFVEKLPGDQKRALVGDKKNLSGPTFARFGCTGVAMQEIVGSAPPIVPAYQLASEIQMKSWNKSFKDPALIPFFGRWSDCMKDSGYRFKTPMDAPGSSRMTRDEAREMAEAEVVCNYESGLLKKWYSIDSGNQREEIAKQESRLREGLRKFEKQVESAKGILVEN
ncbi:hypothetical protein ABZ349_32560 [Streptomyces niveus]|uniref:hypothetical protein n=1 Tax=Streptomyces niveus TaxID=193462 RepID=UPI0033F2DE3D